MGTDATATPGPVRPGPRPQFGHRMELRLRADQEQALGRIARTLDLSVSEVIRWFIDQGTAAVEGTPTFHTLQDMKGSC
jgi:hypothetical protein